MSPSSPRTQLALLIALVALGLLRTMHRASPAPTRAVADASGICVVWDGREKRATLCDDAQAAAWFAPDDVRHALGLPPCWYTAPAARFAELPGVGEGAAAKIGAYRDAGGAPDAITLAGVRGVSARQARAATSHFTTRCARVSDSPIGSGSDAPSGSSRW